MNNGAHTLVSFFRSLEPFTCKDGVVRLAWVSYLFVPSRSDCRRAYVVEVLP